MYKVAKCIKWFSNKNELFAAQFVYLFIFLPAMKDVEFYPWQ